MFLTIIALTTLASAFELANGVKQDSKKKRRLRAARKKIKRRFKDHKNRRAHHVGFFLTEEEEKKVEESPVGKFLYDRSVTPAEEEFLRTRDK